MEYEEESLENFLKWATDLGISDSPSNHQGGSSCLGQSLGVSQFPDAGGRGLAAARDLRKGELILRVPKSALMTRESLLKDETLSVAVKKHSSLSSTQTLAVCLLYEAGKGKSSWWYPYLLKMPRSYDTLACFGQFGTLALQVNDAIWAAEKATMEAESDWKEAIAIMQELKLKPRLLTFRAWLWACATISSRTLHIPWDTAGCLCPVGDLFNYAAPGEEAFHSEDTTKELEEEQIDSSFLRLTDGGYEEDVSSYCFYARKNYKEGEQVLLSYGTYTNLELLEHYGFLLESNPNDKAFITVEPEVHSLCSWPKDSLYIHQNGKPSFALLSVLRLWFTPPNRRRYVGHLVYSGSQISAENENAVMGWITKQCEVILKNLATSIEEDELLSHTIGKMRLVCTQKELENVLSACDGEARDFLESNGMISGESGVNLPQFRQVGRDMDKWKLAVQWRLVYKITLANCIAYCKKVIYQFPSDNESTMTISTHSST